MKRINFIGVLLSIIIPFQLYGQSPLWYVKDYIVKKSGFSSALRKIDDSTQRYFYKSGPNFSYIFNGSDRDLDGDNKSYIDVLFSKNKDTLTALVYTYQLSSKKFLLSATVHGEDHSKRTNYIRKKGDVYVALEDIEIPIFAENEKSRIHLSYILYNKEQGVYFHAFFYTQKYKCQTATGSWEYNFSLNDWRQVTQLGICTEYINGSGLYKKSKDDDLSKEEKAFTFEHFEKIVQEAYRKN